MKNLSFVTASFLILSLLLSGCGEQTMNQKKIIEKQLNEIMAAKTPFGMTKDETPVFNTYEVDSILGGLNGDTIQYDRFGEIDQLEFVVPANTLFLLQRQIRIKTRSGSETLYYKVNHPYSSGDDQLWIDGRFLDLEDIRPEKSQNTVLPSEIIATLKSYKGLPYTWHGTSPTGVSLLVDFHPPKKKLSKREHDDWIMKGFDSLGMLFRASGGKTPLRFQELQHFGNPVFLDLSKIPATDAVGNLRDQGIEKAKLLMTTLKPLDIIGFQERVLIVLDDNTVIESKYRGKFDGAVQVNALYDTLVGLFQKATFVYDPREETEDKTIKRFFVRRFLAEETASPESEDSLPHPSTLDSEKVE